MKNMRACMRVGTLITTQQITFAATISADTMDTFVCNICFKPLEVARFKCICCIDYDVCEEVRAWR